MSVMHFAGTYLDSRKERRIHASLYTQLNTRLVKHTLKEHCNDLQVHEMFVFYQFNDAHTN